MRDNATVTDDTANNRYVITVDGTQAGLEAYQDLDGDRIFYHTEVDDEFNGQGLASVLVRNAVEQAAAEGRTVIPVCPYVKAWAGKHEDYAARFGKVTSAHLAALG